MTVTLANNLLKIQISTFDLEQLDTTKKVESCLEFPNGSTIKYSLHVDTGAYISATVYDREIKTFIPEKIVSKCLFTDAISFKQEIDIPNQKKLSILLEKDHTFSLEQEERTMLVPISSDRPTK